MKNNIKLFLVMLLVGILFVVCAFSATIGGGMNNPINSMAELDAVFRAANPEFFAANDARLAAEQAAGGTTTAPVQKTPVAVKKECAHEYTESVTTEPTCKDEGVKTFTCSKCGDTYTEAIPKTTSHAYVEKVTKEPTCTEKGLKTFTCSICGDVYEREIDALGHDYKSEITTASTCTEKGVKTFTCSRCGDSYTEEIPANGHTEGEFEVSKPAGWFTVGEQVQKCTVCGETLVTEEIPSQYPIWYLYVTIGIAVVVIAGVVTFIVIRKKKSMNVTTE